MGCSALRVSPHQAVVTLENLQISQLIHKSLKVMKVSDVITSNCGATMGCYSWTSLNQSIKRFGCQGQEQNMIGSIHPKWLPPSTLVLWSPITILPLLSSTAPQSPPLPADALGDKNTTTKMGTAGAECTENPDRRSTDSASTLAECRTLVQEKAQRSIRKSIKMHLMYHRFFCIVKKECWKG